MARRNSEERSGPEGDETTADGAETVDISETTAPSIGPNTVIEKDSPEERLARHEQSDKDALGLDKRRQVVGGRYSASVPRQIVTYAIVVAVVLGAGLGIKLLADDLDKPPAKVEDRAPWTGTDERPAELQ
jgi:hypothetical protein